jgi:hypothetical protein
VVQSWATRSCAIFAIGGGIHGVLATVIYFAGEPSWNQGIASLGVIAIHTLGVWAGVELLEGRASGERRFRLFLLFQVPVVQSFALTYLFEVVGGANVLVHPPFVFEFLWHLGGRWIFATFTPQPEFGIGVNLVPLALLLLLRRSRSSVQMGAENPNSRRADSVD